MLEALVSSRIRRTLFEYLLTHSSERFYLRGLAKQLNLSISPLRRELARLEQSGVLQAVEEGNMRFYTVNVVSPDFLQLQHAGLSSTTTAPAQLINLPVGARAIPVGVVSAPPDAAHADMDAVHRDALRAVSAPASRILSGPAVLAGAALVGMALMLLIASLFYVTTTNERLLTAIQGSFTLPSSKAGVGILHPGSTSGAMHGTHWQLIPGSFSGFSTDSHRESY